MRAVREEDRARRARAIRARATPQPRPSWEQECQIPQRRVPTYPVPEDYRFPPRTKTPGANQPAARCEHAGPITVACVLRPGPDFGPAEVQRLYRAVQRHLRRPYRFVCITDASADDFVWEDEVGELEIYRPRHPEWKTKLTKIELFRPDLIADWGRTLYLDLDTIVCGDLEEIASYDGAFAMLRDFYCSAMNGSGMMMWGPDPRLAEIYRDFCAMPADVRQARYPVGGGLGDQLFIRHHTPVAPHQIQDCFPAQIGSYKVHFAHRDRAPTPMPRVVCFHGRPKPGEIRERWLLDHYEGGGI